MTCDLDLLDRYNVPVPRYTSYPTVPYWDDHINELDWSVIFSKDFAESNREDGIALYIHLPFCEKLCTYCGCNKKITANHKVEDEYIHALHNEWQIYRSWMSEKPLIRELHLGGGTPTFFSPGNLEKLLKPMLQDTIIHPDHEFSFEGHPNNTGRQHLETLYKLGFRRVSYGVQDNNTEVQRIIDRIQPFENVRQATENARNIGYSSVNFDLIYGLPLQTAQTISDTVNEIISLKPDRVAFYSYAHVPWTSKGQRLFDDNDLPSAAEKLVLYQTGKRLFLQNGYTDIGMDHFALPHDDLYKAAATGRLHRNFMGYTTQHTRVLIGLGVSSISSTPNAYAQNDKTIHNYYSSVNAGRPAVRKGYILNAEDRRFANYIRDISCRGNATFLEEDREAIRKYCLPRLKEMEADKLLELTKTGISVTPPGRSFIRNICSAFDLHLLQSMERRDKPLFSKSI